MQEKKFFEETSHKRKQIGSFFLNKNSRKDISLSIYKRQFEGYSIKNAVHSG